MAVMPLFQLLLMVLLSQAQEPVCRLYTPMEQPELHMNGDLTIGGIFSFRTGQDGYVDNFRSMPEVRPCRDFNFGEFQLAMTMIFAVEEINQNPKILPGVSLGYSIHNNCGTMDILRSSLALVSANLSSTVNENCKSQAPQAIIGHSGSTPTIAIARTFGQFHIPVISHFATCACLSNRKHFPSFFRTIPTDYYQSRALAQMVKNFGWTWVGAISNGNDYGLNGIAIFIRAAHEEGVCIEYSMSFEITSPHHKILQIVEIIKESTSKVIVAFMSHREIKILMEELHKQNITGLQWIGSDAWITANSLTESIGHMSLIGSIGFSVPRVTIPKLGPFLERVNPSQFPKSIFLKDFWENVFNCSLSPREDLRSCNGSEHLKDVKNSFTDVSDLRFTNNVYKAVYAVGYALHNLLSCEQRKRTFSDLKCKHHYQIQPWEVLYSLQHVNFTVHNKENVFFSKNGDLPAKYELINLQQFSEGTAKIVTVGYYDASLPKDQQFSLNGAQIIWRGGSRTVPVSVCSESCPPGTRKAAQKGRPACCFDCIQCTPGEISNTTDSLNCLKCPMQYWSNTRGDACVPKEVEFLSYRDVMGLLLAILCSVGVLFTILTIFIFYYNKNTPIIRANNSELSFLLLFSLTLCFLSSLTFIGQPSQWSCMLRHTAFGITFVLCISCVLGKTVVVLMAFRATHPGSNVMKWFGPLQQRLSVLAFTIIQALICALWLTISPPFPYMNMNYYQERILFECNLGSSVGFWAVLSYIGFLASLCFVLAFVARKLPDHFNEAKFITFSMFIFCTVWITFIPAYVSSPGKFTVAVEIFAILVSSYSLLFCIFVPKCYVILLRPEMNTKKQVMGKIK